MPPETPTIAHVPDQVRKTVLVPIASLRPDPANVRKHGERSYQAMMASLREFGQQKPVVARPDGTVIAGNGMLEAARRLGWAELAVWFTDLPPEKIAAYALADNRTAELSEWDDDLLKELLGAMTPDMVAATGWNFRDLSELGMHGAGNQAGEDNVPAPPDEATTQPGDLWVLGDHRLLCGDSSSPADLDRLLDGAKIHLLNTDPPYNVKVEPRSNNAIAAGLSSFTMQQRRDGGATDQQSADLHRYPEKSKPTHRKLRAKDRPLANDFVTDEAFEKMLLDWFGNAARVMVPGAAFYIWGGYANAANYPPALKATGLYFSQAVIWVKEHPVLTRKDFMGNHEWCFYGWREGGGHNWYGPNNVPDVWSVKKVNPQSMVHLTEKPVELARRAIQYSSQPGENVLELFGGSGSTLIACETERRRCYAMELDPLYCDVIVKRWEEFTKRKAERIPCPTPLPSPAASPAAPASRTKRSAKSTDAAARG